MRVSRAQAEENRDRVIEASSRLLRSRGLDGVGIADLMKAAGLTHGGFYKQFSSREDLVARACEAALTQTLAFWKDHLKGVARPRAEFTRAYLSTRHRDEPANGCLLPALAAEAARRSGPVRQVFTRAINAYADLLDEAPEERSGTSREQALAAVSQIVGALVLARATDDDNLSRSLLRAALRTVNAGDSKPSPSKRGLSYPSPPEETKA